MTRDGISVIKLFQCSETMPKADLCRGLEASLEKRLYPRPPHLSVVLRRCVPLRATGPKANLLPLMLNPCPRTNFPTTPVFTCDSAATLDTT